MALSIYDASIPWFLHALGNLGNVLDKAAAHCEQEKIDPAVLLGSRLYPDMFPLTRQVQIMADVCKGCGARLTGQEPPRFADNETTIAQLKTRLRDTAQFLGSLERAGFEGAEGRPVELKFPNMTLTFSDGWKYLQGFVLPNVYFHSATAYGILRHNGVRLGKGDFLGAVS